MSTVNDKTPSTPPAGFFYRGQMSTRITREDPLGDNPYLAGRRYTYGYATDELQRHSAYLDVLLLLLRGELPDREECQLLEGLLIGLSNPGPNHPAVRAAMTAGLSKTNVEHLLPVGLLTGGGACSGAAAAADAWEFIKSALTTDAKTCAERLLTEITPDIIAPGFGRSFGRSDPLLEQLANALQTHAVSWPTLAWGAAFVAALAPYGYGWLIPGLVACVAHDLHLSARQCVALFQLALAPAILAHGIEQTHHPITAGPMLDDQDYELL